MAVAVAVNGVWTHRRPRVAMGSGSAGWAAPRVPVLTETFTASASSWPAGWTVTKTPDAGGGAAAAGGKGALATGTSGGYAYADTIIMRRDIQAGDMDIRFSFTLPATETPSLNFIFRADDASIVSGNSYSLDIRGTGHSLVEAKSWSYTTHGTAAKTHSPGTAYGCRVVATGGLIRARTWDASDAEPSTWDLATSAGSRKMPGWWGFSVPGPGEAGGRTVYIDDVFLWDPWQRDKNVIPFSTASIWNTPIGSGATYQPMNMTPPVRGYGVDDAFIVLTPTAPLRNLIDRRYWWPYPQSGIAPVDTGIDVRIPDDYIIPPPNAQNYPNRSSAMIQTDGAVREFQYTVRASAGSDVECHEGVRAVYDLTGDGLTTGPNGGAHGGAGMTVIGGTIRASELAGSGPIRHPLAFSINTWKWAVAQGGGIVDGHRWPATASDANWATAYGSYSSGQFAIPGVGMGSLFAIPPTVNLATIGLETSIGSKMAEALQSYGGYLVDSIGSADNDDWLWNVTAEALAAYPDLDQWGAPTAPDTPTRRDMDRIVTRLALVTNSSSTSIGGGGVPLVPWSPPPE